MLFVGCAAVTARQRAERLEADAANCDSFAAFDDTLDRERTALNDARGEDLVPASRALSAARKRCATAVIDSLFSLQESRGREAAVTEVQALTRAFGADVTLSRLRERWGTGADAFVADVTLAASRPGPTPAQPKPTEPTARPAPPSMPGAESFGDGPSCLRRPTREAATCLGDWGREAPDQHLFDSAVKALVERVKKESRELDVAAAATLNGNVLFALGVPRGNAAVEPLFVELSRQADQLLALARRETEAGHDEAAARIVRPLLFTDATRRRAEPFALVASRKHAALATEAAHRTHAAQVHRRLSAWFMGLDAPAPSLEPGRWSDARWDCAVRKPTFPTLPGGFAGRLTARCKVPRTETKDSEVQALEPLESSTPRVRIDADVTITCGGDSSSQRLSVEELLLDHDDGTSSRPHALDGPLSRLIAEATTRCQASAKKEAEAACAKEMESLDRTQLETRVALRLGRWPACFVNWFTNTYGVSPSPGD